MKAGKENKNKVYIPSMNQFVESDENFMREYHKLIDNYRIKMYKRRLCYLSYKQFYRCEMDCIVCPFYSNKKLIYIEDAYRNSEQSSSPAISKLEYENGSLHFAPTEDVVIESVYSQELLSYLDELLPGASMVTELKLKGHSLDTAIKCTNMSRQTYSNKLKSIKKLIQKKFPEYWEK